MGRLILTLRKRGLCAPKKVKGFTLVEILAAIGLMSIVFAVAVAGFNMARNRMSGASYQLTKDIQTLFNDSLRTGKIYRLSFNERKDGYTLEVFELPRPKPKAEDKAALEKWEREESEIQDALRSKEKFSITRLDRGIFREQKKRTISSSLKLKTFITGRNLKNPDAKVPPYLLFYPTGETDSALIVFEDSSEKMVSLEVNPLSGRVKTTMREITLEEWKKSIGIK